MRQLEGHVEHVLLGLRGGDLGGQGLWVWVKSAAGRSGLLEGIDGIPYA